MPQEVNVKLPFPFYTTCVSDKQIGYGGMPHKLTDEAADFWHDERRYQSVLYDGTMGPLTDHPGDPDWNWRWKNIVPEDVVDMLTANQSFLRDSHPEFQRAHTLILDYRTRMGLCQPDPTGNTTPDPNCPKCKGSGKRPVVLLTKTVYDPCECLKEAQKNATPTPIHAFTTNKQPSSMSAVVANVFDASIIAHPGQGLVQTDIAERAASSALFYINHKEPVIVIAQSKADLDEFALSLIQQLGNYFQLANCANAVMGVSDKLDHDAYMDWLDAVAKKAGLASGKGEHYLLMATREALTKLVTNQKRFTKVGYSAGLRDFWTIDLYPAHSLGDKVNIILKQP